MPVMPVNMTKKMSAPGEGYLPLCSLPPPPIHPSLVDKKCQHCEMHPIPYGGYLAILERYECLVSLLCSPLFVAGQGGGVRGAHGS